MTARTFAYTVGTLLLAVQTQALAVLTQQEIQSLFIQANGAFSQANAHADPETRRSLYDQAALTFERIIQEGQVHNAKLYYNLANAYLLKGDLGRAILNYRRAEQLNAGDANCQKNLAFARSRRIDQIPMKTEQRIMRKLLFWHYDFMPRTRMLSACILFAALCLSLTYMVWRGRSGPVLTLTLALAVLLAALAGSVIVGLRQQALVTSGVICADQTTARQGDGPNYPESFKEPLHAGTEFEILEHRPGWLHIRLTDGSDTWISEHDAEQV